VNYQQHREFRIDTSYPIVDWLNAISSLAPRNPSATKLSRSIPFFRNTSVATEEWYHKAWWGFHTARILFKYLIAGRDDEISNLVSFQHAEPLDTHLSRGQGVIIAGSHLGPELAVLPWLTRYYQQPLAVTSTKLRTGENLVQVGDDDVSRKLSLAKSMLALRRKKLVRIVPDGEYGLTEQSLRVRVNSHRCLVSRGPAELAYVSKAPTLVSSFTWTSPIQISARFHYLDMEKCNTDNKEAWVQSWYQAYLSVVWNNLISQPQDIGFRQGGLYWNRKRWDPLSNLGKR
jgi:hypothetical protein